MAKQIVFAALALAIGVSLAYFSDFDPKPQRTPLDVLHSDAIDTSYDLNYWASLKQQSPTVWRECLDYCRTWPTKPNCQSLARSEFVTSLANDAARVGLRSSAPGTPPSQANAVRGGGR